MYSGCLDQAGRRQRRLAELEERRLETFVVKRDQGEEKRGRQHEQVARVQCICERSERSARGLRQRTVLRDERPKRVLELSQQRAIGGQDERLETVLLDLGWVCHERKVVALKAAPR